MRVGKLASELNLSLQDIVFALHAIGEFVDTNPNNMVDDSMIDELKKFLEHKQKFEKWHDNLIKAKSQNSEKPKLTKESLDIREKYESIQGEKLVYKYYSFDKNLIDSIENEYLYHSNHINFNDPFDSSINLISIEGNKKREFKKLLKSDIESKFKRKGICCFSKDKDSILMWSHYADKHAGVCIAYNYMNIGLKLKEVNYVMNYQKPDIFDNINEAMHHMVYTKAKEWSYEKEVRSIIDTEGKAERRKMPFNINSIHSIYFGINVKAETIEELKKIIKNKNLNVKYYYGIADHHRFSIKWKQIKR